MMVLVGRVHQLNRLLDDLQGYSQLAGHMCFGHFFLTNEKRCDQTKNSIDSVIKYALSNEPIMRVHGCVFMKIDVLYGRTHYFL